METSMLITIGLLVGGVAAGLVVGFLLRGAAGTQAVKEARESAERILHSAQREADARKKEAEIEAKDTLLRSRTDFESEMKAQRAEITNAEKRLGVKEEHLERRSAQTEQKENEITRREQAVTGLEAHVREQDRMAEKLLGEARLRLEETAGMTAEEAKRHLVASLEEEARHDAALFVKRIEDEARENAEKKARHIVTVALERVAGEHAAEISVSAVSLPSDEMKGRIIGREGRNIRALETATGVDLVIDDTPEAVLISCFDPVRREIARVSLSRLVADGRIHPARIEEVVEKVRREIEQTIREEGEKAAFDLGIHDLHPEVIKILGRLKYRTSYGQNVLDHSKQVGYLCGMMAAELGANEKLARRVGLLHDLGKSISHEVEGGHDAIGAEVARKYGESEAVINCIGAHHEGEEARCVEAILVSAADAISAARPGARRDILETYVKRLEKLEEVAQSFKGVEKAYAIQAGREIRIIVRPEEVSDIFSAQISRDIAKKIEKEMSYPGQIKVTVIREMRHVEYAR
ncbi:MAG: ribonuclease Y [Nitrospirae bacterium RBG_16_64_22]|nr:MAG: ribonuclease Y [Nitrospirae bacterium RBG_16_64_22]